MKSIKQIKKETFGDVYTLEEFCDLCEKNIISSYDGKGYFHDGEIEHKELSVWDDTIMPDDVWGKYPYVIWYNK
jgi:hypothetical protein